LRYNVTNAIACCLLSHGLFASTCYKLMIIVVVVWHCWRKVLKIRCIALLFFVDSAVWFPFGISKLHLSLSCNLRLSFWFQDLTSGVVVSPNTEADSSANYDDNESLLHVVNYVNKGKEQSFPLQWYVYWH